MRVDDLAMRAIHAWRAGIRTMAIDLAWQRANPAESRSSSLRGEAIAWREIGRSLNGRSFAGELPTPDGIHAWLADGVIDVVIDQNVQLVGEQTVIRLLGAIATTAPHLLLKNIEPIEIFRVESEQAALISLVAEHVVPSVPAAVTI